MQNHLNQARKNEEFLKVLDDNFSDEYFDWKITVCFYSALHYLWAYAKLKRARISQSHKDLLFHINPQNQNAKLPLDPNIYFKYFDMFNASHVSRYSGFLNETLYASLMKNSYKSVKGHLMDIKKYLSQQGLKIK